MYDILVHDNTFLSCLWSKLGVNMAEQLPVQLFGYQSS